MMKGQKVQESHHPRAGASGSSEGGKKRPKDLANDGTLLQKSSTSVSTERWTMQAKQGRTIISFLTRALTGCYQERLVIVIY
jgi:hypothetical protein